MVRHFGRRALARTIAQVQGKKKRKEVRRKVGKYMREGGGTAGAFMRMLQGTQITHTKTKSERRCALAGLFRPMVCARTTPRTNRWRRRRRATENSQGRQGGLRRAQNLRREVNGRVSGNRRSRGIISGGPRRAVALRPEAGGGAPRPMNPCLQMDRGAGGALRWCSRMWVCLWTWITRPWGRVAGARNER